MTMDIYESLLSFAVNICFQNAFVAYASGKIASLHIASTLLSINDVIISLYIRHHVVKQN